LYVRIILYHFRFVFRISSTSLDQQLAQPNDPSRRALVLSQIRAIEAQHLEILREQMARYQRENNNMESGLALLELRADIQNLMNAKRCFIEL